ncbi:MAG: glycosyltransferase family 4 protein [Pirellulaceae bacterium]
MMSWADTFLENRLALHRRTNTQARLRRTDHAVNSDRLRPRLCYVVTHSMSTCFLRGQLAAMRASGFDVTLLTSPGKELDGLRRREQVAIHTIPMEREMHPWRDIRSLLQLYVTIRRIRPHIVNAGTPKAGLLGMLAAWMGGVPVRIYTLHGLRLETTTGLKRALLAFAERVTSRCATRVICVSRSLRESYVRHRLASWRKLCVLGSGTCNGLDVSPFTGRSARIAESRRAQLRRQFGIPADAPVLGAVGRLTRDKGIADLLVALDLVRQRFPDVHLLLLGDYEPSDPLPDAYLQRMGEDPHVHWCGFVGDVSPYYDAMDLLVHASHREGFPYVPIEGAAAGLPVVGYRVTGVVDAVADGVTGRLVAPRDVQHLSEAICRYVGDPQLRRRHGAAGRARVVGEFSQETVWENLRQEYARLLRCGQIAIRTPEHEVSAPSHRAA